MYQRTERVFLETKKKYGTFHVTSVLLYNSECRNITWQMKRELEATYGSIEEYCESYGRGEKVRRNS